MTNANANFTTKISLDASNGIAHINFEDRDGFVRTFGSFRDQIAELKALRKQFQVIVPIGSDLSEVAGFRTEAKQRRAKSQRQRLIDRVARLRCGLSWDVAKQYNFEENNLERWQTERDSLKGLSLKDLRRAEGVAMKLEEVASEKPSKPLARKNIAEPMASFQNVGNVVLQPVNAR